MPANWQKFTKYLSNDPRDDERRVAHATDGGIIQMSHRLSVGYCWICFVGSKRPQVDLPMEFLAIYRLLGYVTYWRVRSVIFFLGSNFAESDSFRRSSRCAVSGQCGKRRGQRESGGTMSFSLAGLAFALAAVVSKKFDALLAHRVP